MVEDQSRLPSLGSRVKPWRKKEKRRSGHDGLRNKHLTPKDWSTIHVRTDGRSNPAISLGLKVPVGSAIARNILGLLRVVMGV